MLILAIAGLVKALVEGKLDMIWVSASVVVASAGEVVSDVTHHPGGGLVEFVVRAVALVCFGVGFVLLTKDGGLGRCGRSSGPG